MPEVEMVHVVLPVKGDRKQINRRFRMLTPDEIRSGRFNEVYGCAGDRMWRVRKTSQVKEWKRSDRFEVSYKYGMYETIRISYNNGVLSDNLYVIDEE